MNLNKMALQLANHGQTDCIIEVLAPRLIIFKKLFVMSPLQYGYVVWRSLLKFMQTGMFRLFAFLYRFFRPLLGLDTNPI